MTIELSLLRPAPLPVIREGSNQRPDAKQEVVLPVEIMDMILRHLGPKDRLAAGAISRAWHRVAFDPTFWSKMGAPVANLDFKQLAQLTKQDVAVAKTVKNVRRATPPSVALFGLIPGAIAMPIYLTRVASERAACIASYCSAYVGSAWQQPTQSSDWGWGGGYGYGYATARGSDPAIDAECLAHFGNATFTGLSGPYGGFDGFGGDACSSGTSWLPTVGVAIGCTLAGALGGSLVYCALNASRNKVRDLNDDGALELGNRMGWLGEEPPANAPLAQTNQKLQMLDLLTMRLMNDVENGRVRSLPQLKALGLNADAQKRVCEAVMLRAAALGRGQTMQQMMAIAVVPSTESIMLFFHAYKAKKLLSYAVEDLQIFLEARRNAGDAFPSDALPVEYAVELLDEAQARPPTNLHWSSALQADTATNIIESLMAFASPQHCCQIINHPSASDGKTLLRIAMKFRTRDDVPDTALFEELLRHGGDVNVPDHQGISVDDRLRHEPAFFHAKERVDRALASAAEESQSASSSDDEGSEVQSQNS